MNTTEDVVTSVELVPVDLEAVEWIVATAEEPIVALTCEHASNVLPKPWRFAGPDERLRDAHWAIDLGAAALTRELAHRLGAPAVLARFSRLLVDPNRPIDSDTLFRTEAESLPIEFNQAIDDADRHARMRYYLGYQAAVDRMLATHPVGHLFAVHTFTPLYEGKRRPMEVAVLFDQEEKLAQQMATAIADAGFEVRLNEPYSGRLGMMYSASRASASATSAGPARPLEIEVRQDLAVDVATRGRLVTVLSEWYESLPSGS